MNALLEFLASTNGRIVRIVAGVILIVVGLLVVGPSSFWPGLVLAIIGVVPLLAGLLDVCVFAPLFGLPFKGPDIRARQ